VFYTQATLLHYDNMNYHSVTVEMMHKQEIPLNPPFQSGKQKKLKVSNHTQQTWKEIISQKILIF
jgi:hypothetical protein